MKESVTVEPTEKSPLSGGASLPNSRRAGPAMLWPALDEYTQAQVTRRAARINAASVSEDEEKKLHAERHALLDKQFNNTITRKETIRLEYVRWSLDRLDDAKHGAKLDAIERRLNRFEEFAEEIDEFKKFLQQNASRGPHHGRSRR